MDELIPGAIDAATEKHVPVVTKDGSKVVVKVGSVDHPMTPEHYIEWICMVTKEGCEVKYLTPNDAPMAEFMLSGSDEVKVVYEYCNLHGLWKA